MNDREMLEFAAKAAGIDGMATNLTPSGELEFRHVTQDGYVQGWNPMNDDGDALRLAVKLKMIIDQTTERAWATIPHVTVGSEPIVNDPCAATRLAIVRAAAEIGKAMP